MEEQWITHRIDAADHDADELLQREWLLTNGTGAYSMGTALGANTRRYHGLLVAATRPPVGRVVALNQTIDQLRLTRGDATHCVELSSALFPNDDQSGGLTLAPQGHETLTQFEKGLAARWTYRWGQTVVTRTLILHHQQQAVTLRYDVSGLREQDGRATLAVTPLLTLRDFHGLLRRDDAPSFAVIVEADNRELTVERGPWALTMKCAAGAFETEPDWWINAAYPRDTHRGQDDREDLFTPGRFEFDLRPGEPQTFTITAALGEEPAEPRSTSGRQAHLCAIAERLPGAALQKKALVIAADDFVVGRTLGGKTLSTIMAGYPWFADWGRDTFIALPGLLLSTGRHDAAREVLEAFAGSIRHGLVPNRFDDYDASVAHYNTVDASLWYVHAGLEYAKATGESPGWLMRALREIVDAYVRGTEAEGHDGRPIRIAMADDGLIAAGDDHSQLTWMDAAAGQTVFTPRPGKCVEINALWYHVLMGLSELLRSADAESAARYTKLAGRVKRSFITTFWSEQMQRLIDHVRPDGQIDRTLRPNMVFACSLPNSPLPAAKRKLVLAAIRDQLLTPVGLRTLPADDPNYHPRYGGPQFERDAAYHRGTVWPWLIGPYAEGVLRLGLRDGVFAKTARAHAAAAIEPLLHRLMNEGLGQLHEIHDAAEPHAPRGCIAQAWSVAELVRVLGLIG